MESLYLLIPLSAGIVLVIIAVFGWALHRGQFEDVEAEGHRILADDAARLDTDQGAARTLQEESPDQTDLTK
jgi:cbb3-type cytochrome oxidase maturation protein